MGNWSLDMAIDVAIEEGIIMVYLILPWKFIDKIFVLKEFI